MKRFRFRPAYLGILGVLVLAGIYFVNGGDDTQPPDQPVTISGASLAPSPHAPSMPASPRAAPAVIPEEQGHIEIVDAPQFDFKPLDASDREVHLETRVELGDTAKLRFAARGVAGTPKAGAKVTASALHGTDPEQPLEVEKVAEGVFDVPFTPQGPGQFNVVLSVDGVPAGSERVGVVGAVGAPHNKVDTDLLAEDPVQFRGRRAGRAGMR